jgi:antitoxin (DNA-binding transcriptional repressor) of toxin-antitoxin stability system
VLDEVDAGQQVVVTRRGRPVARIVAEPAPRRRSASAWVEGLRGFVEAQPKAGGSSVAAMRDGERY